MKQLEAVKLYQEAVRKWFIAKRDRQFDLNNTEPDPQTYHLTLAVGKWAKTAVLNEFERTA